MAIEVWGTGATQLTHAFAAQGQDLKFSISSPPARGTATIDPSTGQLSYELPGNPASATDAVGVTVSNARGTATARLLLNFKYDPLLAYQWPLKNTGQTVFSTAKPVAGMDLKVHEAWRAGYTGRGVVVNVIDTGLELAHEDLAQNIVANASRNFLTGGKDPTPEPSTTVGDHGTAVAGLIAAQAFNNKGIRGVAPRARLMGHNYLKAQSISSFSQSFGGSSDDTSATADVFNASFGWSTCSWNPPSQAHDAVITNTMTLRAGKGAVIVKSAGNGFLTCDAMAERECLRLGVSCFNANADHQISTMHNAMVVGSVDAAGVKASTASTGSNLWVSSLGGENGADADVFASAGIHDRKPGMLTTDLSGCVNGFHSTRPYNNFEVDGFVRSRLNPECNYTSTFTGTSAAAPLVSGVVALMLEARPELTYRDVKHLLASTASAVDDSRAANTSTAIFGTPFVLEQPWVTNRAGYRFHNWYGFGLVDAAAAVQAARTHVLLPPQQSFEWAVSPSLLQIPATASTAWTLGFNAAGAARAEVVELSLAVDGSFKPSCAQIELQSPLGTRSILLNMRSGHASVTGKQMRLLSNAFYGEAMAGTWTLSIYNACTSPLALAADTPQVLRIKGH